ncbi:hypothetical protein BT93_C1684 [Corymbia citriodora subsp. variegata]|nr:hypothetical protein BT93_C1684 [Corymbia citriodora subsp. variegata]
MIEIQFPNLPASLEELSINDCGSIGRIVFCGEGGSLGVLDQSESSSRESTYRSPGVPLLLPNVLMKLKRLELDNCRNLLEIQVIGTLSSLQVINIEYCDAMEKLSGVSNLKNLHRLVIHQCSKLRVVEGLNELEFLTLLKVSNFPSLETSVDISNSKIPDECTITVDSDFNNKYSSFTFKDYKIMAQQGAAACRLAAPAHLLPVAGCWSPPSPVAGPWSPPSPAFADSWLSLVTGPWPPLAATIAGLWPPPAAGRWLAPTPPPVAPQSEKNKSMEKMKDEAIQRAADMETSDRNYAIAAVQNLVGIDDRVKQITDLLEMEVNDEVRIIGIYGTDGIGKTTLAKAVYKRISSSFDSCSFLVEVEETTQNSHGIQFLQTKLIRDILEREREDLSFDERIEDFLDIFHEMKVLIVVDDVEKPSDLHVIVGDQLHWFGPGTRIIVTSKNSGILKEYDTEKACNYMVSELDDGQAFKLFCKHAFRMQSSIPDYDRLSNRIVSATEKLPLAVEVVGSFLRGKSIQEWEKMGKSVEARAMSSPKTTVGLDEILDICYKELDQLQKDIFLDIACFISGVDAQIASYMWSNCYPSSGCILMPLAIIGENNELQMHRLLRCLGKRIFELEGSGDPSSRRFCTQDMVLKAMNMEKGIEEVEARDSCILTATSFASMPAISFLKLVDAKVSGDFTGAFPNLRWLCWQRCRPDFGAENFVLRELVILDLSWSKVMKNWGGWTEIKMERLRVLNLTGCSDLLITPDFSDYKNLEILILERCSRLVKLHPSIGHLKRLESLNLKFCSRLRRLPEELGRTTALKELFIDGTSVQQIPISIGNLKQLGIISGFKCFSLTSLPSSICYLITLSELSLDGAKITELPSSLGQLLKLRRLSLRECRHLEELPYSIGEMESLEELDISATSISELPDSMGNLKSLRVLRMDSSFIQEFPGEIGNLTNLEELHASRCWNLKGAIPSNIEGLCQLRSLMLGHSGISSLPPEISAIPSLHTLDLIRCNEIEELPKLPPSLILLRVSSKRMKALPLGNLKKLEELCLSDGDPIARRTPSAIEEIEGLERLKALKRLYISNCKIQNINGIDQLTSLRSLILSDCDYLDSLPDLSNLKSLKVLEIRRCKMIRQIEGLEKLTSLGKLNVTECAAENSVQVQAARKHVRARSVEIWGRGDFIKQGGTSLKRSREEILLDTSCKVRFLLNNYKVDAHEYMGLKIDLL